MSAGVLATIVVVEVDDETVKGREFVRRARRHARRKGLDFHLDSRRGKGSHQVVYVGSRRTTVQYSEISPGPLISMLKDLDIRQEDF